MKPPFNFGLRFFFRVLFPGFILTLAAYPAVRSALNYIEIHIDTTYLFAVMVLFLGWLCPLLDMPIYMAFEGRRWPRSLRALKEALINREIKRMTKLSNIAVNSRDDDQAREASTELRKSFPFTARGEFVVKFPTRLGNLIAAYERYPDRVYGFAGTFLWYRIWMKLDKDKREEIDNTQAMADSALYITFSLGIASIVYILYFAASFTNAPIYFPGTSRWFLFVIGTVSALTSWWLYRASLHVHDNFGRLFRAVIDSFITEVSFPEVEKHIKRILNGKTIDVEEEHVRNAMIMDYMLSSRVDSPLKEGERLWLAEWNTHVRQVTPPIVVKHKRDRAAAGQDMISCSGQLTERDHPTVYLKLYPGMSVTCPYCNLKFLCEVNEPDTTDNRTSG
jgi:uncharacterized Zn-finger protein